MSHSHRLSQSLVISGSTRSLTNEYSASKLIRIEDAVVEATVDQLVQVAFTIATMVSCYIYSTQNMTLKTNSSGTPQETINLKANVPLIWNTDSYGSNPFSGDITAMYVSNSSGTDGTLVMEILDDATP